MPKQRKSTEEARSNLNFGIFKDKETDWIFKRTLAQMSEKAAEIGECLGVASRINEKSGDSWITEWAKMARLVEENGDKSNQEGHFISARECYLRACNYYRTAEYGALPEDPRFYEYWDKSRTCFQKAAELFDPPVLNIEVEFEGKQLPGYYWRPDNSKSTRPTLIAVGGGDSSGEEITLWAGPAAVKRGYNYFFFEHPGHRGAVHLYPECIRRPDMEVPFKAAIDYLQDLPGTDDRIAITGFSGGGYTAIRVAAFDDRIQALIPDSPLIDPGEFAYGSWPKLFNSIPLSWMDEILEWRFFKSPLMYARWQWNNLANGDSGLSFEEKFDKHVGSLKKGETLRDGLRHWYEHTVGLITDDMLKGITCPVLGMVGEDEGEMMVHQAKQFIEKVGSGNKRLHVFSIAEDGSDDHCQIDNRSRGNQVLFDWLDEVFTYHYLRPSSAEGWE